MWGKMKKILLAIFPSALVVFLLLFFTAMGTESGKAIEMNDGNILYVGGSGPNNYTSIQDALKDAKDGDTIFVYSGVYYTKSPGISIFKRIRLLGEDRDTTIIDNNGAPLSVNADGVRIENFSIRNGGPWNDGVGVKYVEGAFIKNCKISSSYTGVNVEGSSNVIISNCTIFSNNRSIFIYSSSHNKVENCIFYSNKNGLRISASTDNSIYNCSFTGEGVLITGDPEDVTQFVHDMKNNYVNEKPLLYYYGKSNIILEDMDIGEIILVNCKNFKIRNINISRTEVGIEIQKGDGISISNCSFHHNNYCGILAGYMFDSRISNCDVYNNGFGGIHIFYSRDNIINECEVYSNGDRGILMSEAADDNLISHCNIYNQAEAGVEISFSSKNNISDCNIYDNKGGIKIVYSTGSIIYNNNISSNEIGVALLCGSKYTTISKCNIYSNHEGVRIGVYFVEKIIFHADMSTNDVIYQNNFIKNDIHAYFFNVRRLTWDFNYWDNWKGVGRKIIRGNVIIFDIPIFPLINFDKHPAREPW